MAAGWRCRRAKGYRNSTLSGWRRPQAGAKEQWRKLRQPTGASVSYKVRSSKTVGVICELLGSLEHSSERILHTYVTSQWRVCNNSASKLDGKRLVSFFGH